MVRREDDVVVMAIDGEGGGEWGYAYRLVVTVTLGEDEVVVGLEVENRESDRVMVFTGALHTYFGTEAMECRVEGLKGCTYADSTDGWKLKRDEEQAVVFRGETDRVYYATPRTALLTCPGRPTIRVVSSDTLPDMVIWNPSEKRPLPDLEADGWKKFVCIESAAVEAKQTVPAGGKWAGFQRIMLA